MKIKSQIIFSIIIFGLIFILNIVKIKILSNILTPEDYGYYSLFFSSISYISMLIFLGAERYLVKVCAESSLMDAKVTLKTLQYWYIAISILLIPFLFFIDISPFPTSLVILSLFLLGLIHIYRFYLLGLGAGKSYNVLNLLTLHGWLILIPLYKYGLNKQISLKIVIEMMTMSFMITVFICCFLYLKGSQKSYKKKVSFSFNTLKKSLIFSVPLLPMVLSSKFMEFGDRFFLLGYVGPNSVGIYSIAVSLIGIVIGAISVVNDIIRPKILKIKSYEDSYLLASNNIVLLFIVAAPIVAVLCIFASTVIKIFSSSDYLYASSLFILLIPKIYAIIIVNVSTTLLEKSNRTFIVGKWYLIGLLIYIVGNFTLIPFIGLNGAAYSGSISAVTMAIGIINEIGWGKYNWKNIVYSFIYLTCLLCVGIIIRSAFGESIQVIFSYGILITIITIAPFLSNLKKLEKLTETA